ncbi:MAG: hypothetical protein HN377_06485 [Alphaproteobacteria bacterium]|nr:hypothetical protein [Alphaproteobacteria bacterium]MBT7942606.1 hypothetical protein [Alphaproteobacteria bacterium]
MPGVSGRRPVLAVGSNQSPEQLLRKFNDPDCGPIPVIRARLVDFDVVYSPHVAAYGSIPATLAYSPGTVVSVFVNWLTPDEEDRMHATEVPSGNYHFGRLDGIELQLDRGQTLTSAFVYCSRRGALVRDGRPVALSEIFAEGRQWPSLRQEEIQSHVRDRVDSGRDLDDFIGDAIADALVRRSRTELMMAESQPFEYPDFKIIP